jgi:hypothetical protein
MPKKIIYRKQLLRAIEAFLEGTPVSRDRAQRIIHRCYAATYNEEKKWTLDQIIWGFLIKALTDSVYYESEAFLQETRELLLGHSVQNVTRTIFMDDYRVYFTPDEAEWYKQLLGMLGFITAIPFAKIHEATVHAWHAIDTWTTTRLTIPEAAQAEEIEEEYRRRKTLIEAIAARSPFPENIGDEKIYQMVLREITTLVTGVSVGRAAIYCGYPTLDSPYSAYGTPIVLAPGVREYVLDVSESIIWARRVLEALAGKGGLFVSWRLSRASTFDTDVLLVSLH